MNVQSHIFAAKHVLPQMLERGEGYLVNTSSAAGLLTQLGAAGYAVTKSAAVSFAEWIKITYGNKGNDVARNHSSFVKGLVTIIEDRAGKYPPLSSCGMSSLGCLCIMVEVWEWVIVNMQVWLFVVTVLIKRQRESKEFYGTTQLQVL